MKITTRNFENVEAFVRQKLAKQARFAGAVTLNQLAQGPVRADLQHEMQDSLDRPTPFTLNSLKLVKRATVADPSAVLDFKDVAGGTRPASSYLRWQVEGGQRRLKAFERALRSVIPALGAEGYVLVPGKGAKLDEYGNVSRGQIVAILSYFRAFQEAGKGFKMNSTAATRARMAKGTRLRLGYRYFAGRPGGRGPLGIYQDVRIGPGIRELLPVFLFVTRASYQPRLDLQYAAELSVQRNAATLYRQNLAQALATAR